ncbi:MAG: 50S ribosomal protein L6 [Rhodobacteraceae bacterium]|nr:50S ribosomal protein L6 [Paracoccaceae bacterium]
MSRIGKIPVGLPDGVSAKLSGRMVEVKGPRGSLCFTASDQVSIEIDDKSISVSPRGNSKFARQQWGMSRSMVANCIEGVTRGFSRELAISGVGYRADLRGSDLHLSLGLSHEVKFEPRDGLTITVPKQTQIIIEGNDKQKVGQLAAEIRNVRPPEPFKGKGIRYSDEIVVRKVGKKK